MTYVAHLHVYPALLVRLNEAAMRILDGLATLSESEAKQVKPQQEEPCSKSVILIKLPNACKKHDNRDPLKMKVREACGWRGGD